MSGFELVFVPFGIVLGLAVTEVLAGNLAVLAMAFATAAPAASRACSSSRSSSR